MSRVGRGLSRAGGALAAVVAVTSQVAAHPGHGITGSGDSPVHYMIEPAHAGSWLVAAVVVIGVVVAVVVKILRGRKLNAS